MDEHTSTRAVAKDLDSWERERKEHLYQQELVPNKMLQADLPGPTARGGGGGTNNSDKVAVKELVKLKSELIV